MHARRVHFAAAAALLFTFLLAGVAAAGPLDAPDPLNGSGLVTQVSLFWSDPNKSEKAYEVERAPGSGGSFTVIATLAKNMTSYVDSGLAPGTTFRYRVRATGNGNSASPYTSVLTVSTLPANADLTPPSIAITSPTNGTTFTSPQTVAITATTSDNVGVTKVEFFVNNTLASVDTTAPFTHSWPIAAGQDGSYNWFARAYDAAGNTALALVSVEVAIGGADTTPPVAAIVSPASGTMYTSDQNITIITSASDNQAVTRVDFLQNGVLRHSDTSAPFNHVWSVTESQDGTHAWSLRAYDAAGNMGTSPVVFLTVSIGSTDTQAPTVTLTSPPHGVTYTTAQTVNVAATASDDFGVTRVDFLRNGVVQASDTTAPYSHAWPIDEDDNGTYTWSARAYDAAGHSTFSNGASVTVDVQVPDTSPPSVSITSPVSGTTYTSAGTVTMNATATDDVGVTKVEFYDNGVLKRVDTLAPFTNSWTLTENLNGTHNWTARAYDAAGNTANSNLVVLIVDLTVEDTTLPTVAITSPANGTTYDSDQTVVITATASDNVGVTKVEFYDGGLLKKVDSVPPYTHNWLVDESQNGAHGWTARAFDAAGNTRTSSVVTLTVDIQAADTTPPNVSITSPANGSSYNSAQTVTMTASASDNVGVTKVEFYDGGVLKRVDTAFPYTHNWVVDSSQNGSHVWTAKAFDAAGNVGTSGATSVSVSIAAAGGDPALIGFLPGAGYARDVVFDPAQSLAYVSSDEFGLSVFDVSVPSDPVALGSPLDPFAGTSVAVSGTRAVVCADDGLRVLDVSDPVMPVVRGMIANAAFLDVAISGNYAYARMPVPGNPAHVDLVTINISNLSNPTIVNQRFVASGDDVAVANGKLYATTGSGLQIYSLSNPGAPSPQGSVTLSGGTRELAVSGSYAYVSNNTTLHTINVSNANSPSVTNSRSGGGTTIGLANGRLYLVKGDNLEIFSLGNPALPSLLGTTASHNAQGVSANGTVMMLSSPDTFEGGFYLVQTSSPSSSTMLAMVPAYFGNTGVSSNGSLSAVSSADTGLWIVDVTDPNLPEVIGNEDIVALDVAQSGSYAYVRMSVPGNPARVDLVTVSLSNPSNPTIVNQRTVAAGDDVEVANGKLYVTTGSGLQIYSLANPSSPSPQGSVTLSGGTRDLAVSGSYAYVINNTTFHVINVSNANSPSVVASLSRGGTNLGHSGSYAYLVGGDNLEVINVANPSSPALVASVPSHNAKSVAVSGGRAYLATVDQGLIVYDITNPASPQAQPSLSLPGPGRSTFALGTKVYVGGDVSVLSVVEASP